MSVFFVLSAINLIVYAENNKINVQKVLQAQNDWANSLVDIGKCYTEGKDYRKVANDIIGNLYAYESGQVLFKPTKVSNIKFRSTKEGALSYFIGHNKNFPEDKGFALHPWIKVEFKNAGVYINDNVAVAMGEYSFTPLRGKTVTVEYTFGYIKEKDGKLKIFLHHSSLPYNAN